MNRPTKGQRFRARQDVEVIGVISFAAPFTSGFRGTFPSGATAVIEDDPPSFARAAHLLPDEYELYEHIFVPQAERRDDKYSSYAIVVPFEQLATAFEIVDAG